MTLGHPLVDAVIDDLRLTPVEVKCFRVLWTQGDFEHFVEKKSDVLAAEVGTDRSYAAAALRKLVEFGYLEAGERSAKGIGTYRLPRGVPAPGAHSPTSAVGRRIRRQIAPTL